MKPNHIGHRTLRSKCDDLTKTLWYALADAIEMTSACRSKLIAIPLAVDYQMR